MFAATIAALTSHTPPSSGEREHGGVLPLARPEQRPRAAQRLPGPDQLDHQPGGRHHDERGERAADRDRRAQQAPGGQADARPQRADDDGDEQQRRGRCSGPATRAWRAGSPHRTSRRAPRPRAADADRWISSSPGTRATQASGSRFGAGNARAGSAPATSTPYLAGFAMLRPTAMTRLSARSGGFAPVAPGAAPLPSPGPPRWRPTARRQGRPEKTRHRYRAPGPVLRPSRVNCPAPPRPAACSRRRRPAAAPHALGSRRRAIG